MALAKIQFPQHDLVEFRNKRAFYRAAAVCRRGHVADPALNPTQSYPDDSKCVTCGALILIGCLSCQTRTRGRYISGYGSVRSYARPSFCDSCGVAYPWATREERIFELENILDEEEMDEDRRLRGRLRLSVALAPRPAGVGRSAQDR